MIYDPSIFTSVTSLDAAKRIILTDDDYKTHERWERETPHICDLVDQQAGISSDSIVLDYGCGVGRIAKELIKRHECFVIGVDIAPNMQALAASYVNSDRFMVCHPRALSLLGVKADLALTIWVLQHVVDPWKELDRIKSVMKDDGRLFVVNEGTMRCIPTAQGWRGDGIDIRTEVLNRLRLVAEGHMDASAVGERQSKRTFWAIYD